MYKAFLLAVTAAAVVLVSGCALVGTYTKPATGGGKHVTFGLISVDAVSDGYPMIPLYNSYEQAK